jgi:hypothetical protein
MHKDFADWYQIADIQPNGVTLEKRWQAIETFSASADATSVLELLRLFFARPLVNTNFLETYRQPFKDVDVTFPMRNNGLELQILAGATLVQLWESGKKQIELADAAALGMVCTSYRQLQQGVFVSEMVNKAREHLSERSGRLRALADVPEFTVTKFKTKENLEKLQNACANNQVPNLSAPFTELVEQLTSTIKTLVTSTTKAIEHLAHSQKLRHEESNILWWLFGEHSRDCNKRMVDLGFPAVCLIAAKELADLTVVLPGPLAASAFLDKILHIVEPKEHDSTTLQKAVNATPREWREQWMKETDIRNIEDLCPVLFAVRKSLDTNGPEDWVPAFEKATGFKASESISSLNLACQTYEENLFVRAVANCG